MQLAYSTAIIAVLILWSSLIFDVLVGDPETKYHPVSILGILIEKLQVPFRARSNGVFSGSAFAVMIISVAASVSVILLRAASLWLPLYFLLSLVMLKFTFAVRSMKRHTGRIVNALSTGDIKAAREALSMVVRRDTADLDERYVCSACIETVAEGFLDGVATPLIFYGILGVPAAIAVRAVNTLDSMVGYRDSLNLRFGKASALMDTAVNFVPARISAGIISVSARILGAEGDGLNLAVEAHKTESRNGGWPMAAMACSLGINLEKIGHYSLNSTGRTPNLKDVRMSIRVFYMSIFLLYIIVSLEILLAATVIQFLCQL